MAAEALGTALLYTGLAGAAIPVGAYLGHREHLRRGHFREDLLTFLVAFGGGALVSAVALVLVPAGAEGKGPLEVGVAFLAGALVFMAIDVRIERSGAQAGLVVALLVDFIPESIALGAAVATGSEVVALLALLIGLQNLPEGFSAYKELVEAGRPRAAALRLLAPMALLGPAAGLLGFFVLAQAGAALGFLLLFAGGGILYLLFHDVAPLAHRKGHWLPTLGAIAGFLVGLVGEATMHA